MSIWFRIGYYVVASALVALLIHSGVTTRDGVLIGICGFALYAIGRFEQGSRDSEGK